MSGDTTTQKSARGMAAIGRNLRTFQSTKLYDLMAAAPLIAWYGLSAGNLLQALGGKLAHTDLATLDLHGIVSILAQGAAAVLVFAAMVFLLLRGPAQAKSKGIVPRFIAFAGACLSVAVVWLPQYPLNFALSLVSLSLMLGGVGFTVFALLHLGRSFSMMPEARRLVTDGPYASVRHPLYLGEAVSMIGLTLQYLSPLAVVILAVQLGLQIERMKYEEQVLYGKFPEYDAYRQRTARLLPGVY